MRFRHLLGVIWACIVLEAALANQCIRRSSELAYIRRCRQPCVVDSDCKGRKKTCNCDGECGMSCYNMDAVCGEPDAILNGTVIRNGLRMQSVATYSCDAGFVINGIRKRICRADKKWHARAPRCIVGCSRPSRIAHAFLPTLRRSFRVGEKPMYRCWIGYYTYDDRSITCMKSGRWSVANFRCQKKTCRAISTVLNGRINYSSNYFFESIATLQCIPGFDLQYKGRRLICASRRYGSPIGFWSGPPLGECVRKRCNSPPSPRNGRFEYTSSSTKNEYQTEIKYLCDVGFRLEGINRNICDYTGNWGEPPDCIEIFCNRPRVGSYHVLHTDKQSWRIGESVTASCKDGFAFSYSRYVDTATCTDSGDWDSSFTPCQEMLCSEARRYIPNGERISISMTEVTYRCNENYQIFGRKTMTVGCRRSSFFSTSHWAYHLGSLSCQQIHCNRPELGPQHVLKVDQRFYRINETATAHCTDDYGDIQDNFVDTITCTNSGHWSSVFAQCQDCYDDSDCGNNDPLCTCIYGYCACS